MKYNTSKLINITIHRYWSTYVRTWWDGGSLHCCYTTKLKARLNKEVLRLTVSHTFNSTDVATLIYYVPIWTCTGEIIGCNRNTDMTTVSIVLLTRIGSYKCVLIWKYELCLSNGRSIVKQEVNGKYVCTHPDVNHVVLIIIMLVCLVKEGAPMKIQLSTSNEKHNRKHIGTGMCNKEEC